MADLPLPISPRHILANINKKISYSAATWKDAENLRKLARDERTPIIVRVGADAQYSTVAVECATAAILLTEQALDEQRITADELNNLSTIAHAEELPANLRNAAANLMNHIHPPRA